MTDELTPSDEIYYGIASLPGWDYALRQAQDFGGAYQYRVGALLSSILLAGGENTTAVAVAGELSDDGKGFLAVLYPRAIVHVSVEALSADSTDSYVVVHPLSDVKQLSVLTRHNFYDGTERGARYHDIEFDVQLDGELITFKRGRALTNRLTSADGIFAAWETIRDQLGH